MANIENKVSTYVKVPDPWPSNQGWIHRLEFTLWHLIGWRASMCLEICLDTERPGPNGCSSCKAARRQLGQEECLWCCGVDASNQEELTPGRPAGGPRGPHEEGAHGPQQLQVGQDGEGLHWTRWPGNQSCHHLEESCLHKLILIVLAVYLYGK